MSNTTHFTPGPSQLYPGMDSFLQDALTGDVATVSHRSQSFKDMYGKCVTELRRLFKLPESHEILFINSATESFERIYRNCVSESGWHFVNGSFSKKFYEYGNALAPNVNKTEVDFGQGFSQEHIESITGEPELIAVTQNETSTGVSFPLELIAQIRSSHPESLLAVDVVSTMPFPELDWSIIDTCFFSVQKCFGLPAGLGVWIVNDRMVTKAEKLKEAGHNSGPHNELLELVAKGKNNQTPFTPNALGIYLLSRVAGDMNKKTSAIVRSETLAKARLLYEFIDESEIFDFAVENPEHRSQTVVVAKSSVPAAEINSFLANHNMAIGAGYGKFKSSQVRIANFPAHDLREVKKLVDRLREFETSLTLS